MKKLMVILLVIGLFLGCSFAFSQTVQEVQEKIKQLRQDYNKLKRDIQNEEQRLDLLIAQCLQCMQPKINSKIPQLKSRLTALLTDLSTVEQMIHVIDSKIDELKIDIQEKEDELTNKKAELRQKQWELNRRKAELREARKQKNKLWRKPSQDQIQILQNLYNQLRAALQNDDLITARNLENDIRTHEADFGIAGHYNLVQRINITLPQAISQLEQEILQLNSDISNLPAIIRGLKSQLRELTSARNSFSRVKNGIMELQIELFKLEEKVKTLEKLLALKKKKKADPKKTKDINKKLREEVEKLKERKRELERLKRRLARMINREKKEQDPEKKKELEEEIKSTKEKAGFIPIPEPEETPTEEPAEPEEKPAPKPTPTEEPKPTEPAAPKETPTPKPTPPKVTPTPKPAKPKPTKAKEPLIPTPKLPNIWEILMKWFRAFFSLTPMNDYIGWINSGYSGNIDEITSGNGISLEVIYNLNSTVGVGFSYEHLWASTDGTLEIPWPPETLSHTQSISTDGFLALATFTIPENIDKFDIKGIVGVGIYRSNYKETENGYLATGTGSNFGYKVGLGLNYSFTKNYGICGEASYRGINIDEFKDSAGNTMKYISTYGDEVIKADLSGFGVSVGVFFRF